MLCLDICSFPFKHIFVVFPLLFFKIKIKKNEGEDEEFFFFFFVTAFQILYVFLSDISVHCALIEYAYI
jgi:hypothetical protein